MDKFLCKVDCGWKPLSGRDCHVCPDLKQRLRDPKTMGTRVPVMGELHRRSNIEHGSLSERD